MPDPLDATLAMLASVTASLREPWWLIGSTAARLHGVAVEQIGDVDVLLGAADADRVFATLGLPLVPGEDHPIFRSRRFGRWTRPPLVVEFMAGFEHRSGGVWQPVLPSSRRRIDRLGAPIFMPDRNELIAILRRFDRPKDRKRADALERLPA